MREGIGWSVSDFDRALDTCLDLHLVEGTPDPSMHQLFAAFLRETKISADDQSLLQQIRGVQVTRFVELGNALSANPADPENAATLLSYFPAQNSRPNRFAFIAPQSRVVQGRTEVARTGLLRLFDPLDRRWDVAHFQNIFRKRC
jgi:hypothetical protein